MGSIYRSEVMSLCQIFLQTDSAYQCVAELGELGLAQFLDLNEEQNAYQKKFVNEVRRCEEMERKLRFIEDEVQKDDVEIVDHDEHIPAPQPKNMVELEANFEKLEEELISINKSTKQLKKNHVQLLEMKAVLEKVQSLLDESKRDAAMSISEASRGEAGPFTVGIKIDYEKERREETELRFITGVISRSKVISFERFIWRFCRGKVFVRTVDITEQTELFDHDKSDDKAVFILFFSGDQLRTRVQKICAGFHAVIYNCPENRVERAHLLAQINGQVGDMQSVISKTLEYRHKIIFAAALSVKKWSIMLLKLKSIFHTLNMFAVDVTYKCLIAECWIPTVDLPLVKAALRKGTEQAGSTVHAVLNEMETHKEPPTHFKLNKFTQGFQNIVDAYGIANYREVNPAPWSIISFPFLFAVMFGDSGHGIIMLLAALAFVIFEKKLIAMKIKDEIFNTFFGGRYVILLMGIFSVYTGLLYNDIYSKSINIFSSSWKNPYPQSLLAHMEEEGHNNSQTLDLTFPPEYAFDSNLGPYPFGVDPVWNIAKNKLNFLNPMKMKTSIIVGISQMAFGLLLSLCNHIHNRSVVDVLFVFIPQVFFLFCIFVYLCVMVVMKWIFFYVKPAFIFGRLYPGSYCAPSLLIGLINMFMLKARDPGFVQHIGSANATDKVTIDGKNYTYDMYDQCYLQQWYPNQVLVEEILPLLAVVSIPVMLLVKPFYVRSLAKRGLPIPGGHGHGGDESEEFSFGDVMVYQAIHTIEFALGCISHTASYLRLWALSLAHAQLSEVLWDMLLAIGLDMGGWAGSAAIFILYFFFGVLSISILILMEGLSAFLHALRLHWVEFNSKFYGGTGHAFEPFHFLRLIRVAEGLEQ
uniref:V-type proton ATPase subunit a n=1 Tax=Haemonchus contortus TaxID=6289 RepID=E1UW35_HAECO|nr:vacuolar ATPase a subunit [Haemonchus contortus]